MLALQRQAGNRAVTAVVQRKDLWGEIAEGINAIGRDGIGAIPVIAAAAGEQAHVWEATDASGLPGRLNGPRDALRHSYLSAVLTALTGNGTAVDGFMRNHEESGGSPGSIQSRMDYANNAVGIAIGTRVRADWAVAINDPLMQRSGMARQVLRRECYAACRAAVDAGETVFLPNTVNITEESTWETVSTACWPNHEPTYWDALIYTQA